MWLLMLYNSVIISSETQGLVVEVSIAANDGIRGVIEWTNTM